jgi:hypothetical protein
MKGVSAMKKVLFVIIFCALLSGGALASSMPEDTVHDNAQVLSQSTLDLIAALNEEIFFKTGGTIYVVTDSALPKGFTDSDAYAARLFANSTHSTSDILLYFATDTINKPTDFLSRELPGDVNISIISGSKVKKLDSKNLINSFFFNFYNEAQFDRAVQALLPQFAKLYGLRVDSAQDGEWLVTRSTPLLFIVGGIIILGAAVFVLVTICRKGLAHDINMYNENRIVEGSPVYAANGTYLGIWHINEDGSTGVTDVSGAFIPMHPDPADISLNLRTDGVSGYTISGYNVFD